MPLFAWAGDYANGRRTQRFGSTNHVRYSFDKRASRQQPCGQVFCRPSSMTSDVDSPAYAIDVSKRTAQIHRFLEVLT